MFTRRFHFSLKSKTSRESLVYLQVRSSVNMDMSHLRQQEEATCSTCKLFPANMKVSNLFSLQYVLQTQLITRIFFPPCLENLTFLLCSKISCLKLAHRSVCMQKNRGANRVPAFNILKVMSKKLYNISCAPHPVRADYLVSQNVSMFSSVSS